MPSRPLRIFYAAGPGDILGTYDHWKSGTDDPSQVAVTYSAQFYDVCRDLGAEALAWSTSPRRGELRDGAFRIMQRPVPFRGRGGVLYHLGQVWWALRITAAAARFGADVALVSDTLHCFALGLMPLLGIRVVCVFHTIVWPKYHEPRGLRRLLLRLNGRFFRRSAAAFMCVSRETADQVRQLLAGVQKPLEIFTPIYRRGTFDDVRQTPEAVPPMRVLFAGRIERGKGVFELLDIARRFAEHGRRDIEFDLCGEGGALDDLRRATREANLEATFRCHGHLDRRTMRQMLDRAHVVIVPTTSEFGEGFNKVVAEGVLAGRPVVTSSVCPALDTVRDAVLEVPPDDTRAYGDAILRLRDDAALYEQRRQACLRLREQFYDVDRGWAATAKRVIAQVLPEMPQRAPSAAAP